MEGHKLCTLICAFADRKIFVNCVTLDHVVLCFFYVWTIEWIEQGVTSKW